MTPRTRWMLATSAVLLLCACRKPGPSTTQPAQAAYDPKTDPLVNPPSLFQPPPKDPSEIALDGTLFLQLDGSPNTLNPIFASSGYEFTLSDALYAGLFGFDKQMNWKVNDDVVESFQESADHTTITAKLKPNLKWHDGEAFTAEDVVYSWKTILDPRVPCPAVKTGTDEVKQCVALDALTVKFVQEPMVTAKWNVLFPILPKHIFEKEQSQHPDLKTGDYYTRQGRQPVGNGPYRFVEWKENDKIVVERWDGYAGKKPYFKRIVFRIIPDHNVTLLSFEKEDIDAIERLSALEFARQTNTDTFRKVGYKGWGTEWTYGYIGYNMDGSNPFFKDRNVRYAMTHALNIPLIINQVTYGLASQCTGIFHPDSWMFNPAMKLLDYNPARSAALLDEAGWKVDPKDGWRYKQIDGKPVQFEYTLLMPQGSPTGPKIAAIFQEDLKKIGVSLKTREIEWATFHEKVDKHEYQAEIARWGTGTDPDTEWNLWRTEEYKTGRNYGGYSNPRVDELLAKGRREFNAEARKKIYQELSQLIYDDQPYTWIYNQPLLTAFNKRIHGVQFSPRGIYNFDPSYFGWWVSAQQGKHAAMTRN